eukprot:4490558-Pyramimonas_sp.AAC.1
MTAGCEFWLGEQGAIMRPQTVPAMVIMAIRTVGGGALWPPNLIWKYPELVTLPAPRSQCEVCEIAPVATPAAWSSRTRAQAPKAKPMH